MFHEKSPRLVDSFSSRKKLDKNILELSNIWFEYQLINILTKIVISQVFGRLLDKLEMYEKR